MHSNNRFLFKAISISSTRKSFFFLHSARSSFWLQQKANLFFLWQALLSRVIKTLKALESIWSMWVTWPTGQTRFPRELLSHPSCHWASSGHTFLNTGISLQARLGKPWSQADWHLGRKSQSLTELKMLRHDLLPQTLPRWNSWGGWGDEKPSPNKCRLSCFLFLPTGSAIVKVRQQGQ